MCFKAECLIKEEKPPFDLKLFWTQWSRTCLIRVQHFCYGIKSTSVISELSHRIWNWFICYSSCSLPLTSDYVFYMFTCLQRPTENLNANTGARSWWLELIYLLIFLFFCESSDTWFLGYVYLVFNFYTETVIVNVLMKRWKSVGIFPTRVISAATGSQALELKVSFCFDCCLSCRLFEDAALISDRSQRIKF